MRRLHLLELEDQTWCPGVLRDAITDFLRLLTEWFAPYAPAARLLAPALARVPDRQVLDLCSGGGGPWRDLLPRIAAAGGPAVQVRLTDVYPNRAALDRLSRASGGAIEWEPEPVDATDVPRQLTGFRTLFTALHHFRPEAARAVLADAVRQRRGIGVFEMTHRSLWFVAGMLWLPVMLLVLTPFIRPFRWDRLVWTYLIPVAPLAVWFDGTVSCLRSYTPGELRAMVAAIDARNYEWEIGRVRGRFPGLPAVTYVIGVPVPEPGAGGL